MHFGKRRTSFVAQDIAADNFHTAILGMDLHIKFYRFDCRPWQLFIFEIFLLIICLPLFALIARFIAVEDLEIVPGVGAGPDHCHQRCRHQRERRTFQAMADAFQPAAPACVRTARPDDMGDNHQDDGKGEPIGAQHPCTIGKSARAVHVAQRFGGIGTIAVKRVGVAHVDQEDACNEPDEEHAPADIFVRAQRLEEHGEDGNQQHVDGHRHQEPCKIAAQAKFRRTLYQLEKQPRRHCDKVEKHQHQEDSQHFGQCDRPIWRWGGIDDFTDLCVAFTPDQLSPVKDRDDQQEDRKALLDVGDDVGSLRIRRRPEHGLRQEQPCARVDDGQQQQHNQPRAAQHLHDFGLEADEELRADRAGVETLRYWSRHNPIGGNRRILARPFACQFFELAFGRRPFRH